MTCIGAWTYSSSSGSVLSGTSSNVVDLGVGDDVVVADRQRLGNTIVDRSLHRHVLLLGQDGIIGLQVIFLEVLCSLGRSDLDVELDIVSLPLLCYPRQ